MRREIVEDDMDLLLWPALRHNLSQEIHEVGTGVTGRRFPMNPSCLGVQRGAPPVARARSSTRAKSASVRTSNGTDALKHRDEFAFAMASRKPIGNILCVFRKIQHA